MIYPRKRGATSVMIRVFIPNNSVTTGAGLTGLTSASTNLTIAYIRELDSASTSYTGANIEAQTTIGTFQAPSSSAKIRFKVVDATNFPGVYELQFHDSATAFGTGDTSQHISINIYEASTSALLIGPNMIQIPLVPWDPTDSVRMGLTALPNAAAGATNGLPLSVDSSGRVDVLKINGTSQTARDIGASVLLSSGSGTGQITLSSGAVTVGTNNDKTGYALTSGYDPAKTAAQAGDAMALTAGERTTLSTSVWASATRTLSSFGTLVADVATAVWGAAARTLTAFGFTVDTNANATETAIKTQTDKLVFGIANQVDANIQSINNTTITGDGQPGTEFGV